MKKNNENINIEPVEEPVKTAPAPQVTAQPVPVQPVAQPVALPVNVPERDKISAAIKRISWGAILAGVVMTLVTQLLLGILGLGIGASGVNPTQEQNPFDGIGLGAAIWFLISTLLALLAGGWVAGRLAGMPHRTDSFLHGLLTWGLTTLVTFYLLTTTIGGLISGAAGVMGQGLSLVGRGVAAAAPAVGSVVSDQLEQNNVDLDLGSIQQEAETLLRQTNKPALQPGNLQNQAQNAVNAAQNQAGDAARNPQGADQDLQSLISRISRSGQKTINAADKEALVNVLVARTDLNQQQASATVDRWNNTYSQAVSTASNQYDELKTQAGQQARETGGAAADAVSKAALWTFVILLAGAGAAALGGALGAPKDEMVDANGARAV